jgi:hypothetical protein
MEVLMHPSTAFAAALTIADIIQLIRRSLRNEG